MLSLNQRDSERGRESFLNVSAKLTDTLKSGGFECWIRIHGRAAGDRSEAGDRVRKRARIRLVVESAAIIVDLDERLIDQHSRFAVHPLCRPAAQGAIGPDPSTYRT
jgi:hypothetical protein